ncbi:MAG: hypothetical protein KatS3mg008_1020 [Acidimicrobiales bacterium]|nr:MAG: hypothetical protein KatS3mg008_1020 [Acidimicrobiales bacterium]
MEVIEQSPDVASLCRWASRPECGAVVVFTGITRQTERDGEPVGALEYEIWQEEAEKRMRRIAVEALRRWRDLGAVAIVHRSGVVEVGEPSVVCVASSPHRAEAFEAARFLIDEAKERLPIWKKEVAATISGWVEGVKIRTDGAHDGEERSSDA